MKIFNDIQYGLHDTNIHQIEINQNGIIMHFNEGVYLLNEHNKETVLTNACRLYIRIDFFNSQAPYEHIIVSRIYKNKIKEIDIKEFFKYMKLNYFTVDLDFYSNFSNSILLKGYIDKFDFEIIISEIQKFEFDIIK